MLRTYLNTYISWISDFILTHLFTALHSIMEVETLLLTARSISFTVTYFLRDL